LHYEAKETADKLPAITRSGTAKKKKYVRVAPVKVYECTHCAKRFRDISELNRHLSTHDPSLKRYACSFCSLRFMRKDHLRQHETLHLAGSVMQPYKCIRSKCGQQFTDKESLKKHMTTHPWFGRGRRRQWDETGGKSRTKQRQQQTKYKVANTSSRRLIKNEMEKNEDIEGAAAATSSQADSGRMVGKKQLGGFPSYVIVVLFLLFYW
jgi:DNA-directed RNA polymerase subunit RPC12/RpoP